MGYKEWFVALVLGWSGEGLVYWILMGFGDFGCCVGNVEYRCDVMVSNTLQMLVRWLLLLLGDAKSSQA
jgi:hypothetical protein